MTCAKRLANGFPTTHKFHITRPAVPRIYKMCVTCALAYVANVGFEEVISGNCLYRVNGKASFINEAFHSLCISNVGFI